MGLNNVEKSTFQFLKSFHFYLWPFPLQWNANYQQLIIMKPYFKYWVPPIFILFFALLYSLCALFTSFYIRYRYSVERIEIMVQILICCALAAPVLTIFCMLLNVNIFILGFNAILRMAVKINNGKTQNFLNTKFNLLNWPTLHYLNFLIQNLCRVANMMPRTT